jgi:hypothetical protein
MTTEKTGLGRGKFTPVAFTYTGLDGKEYTWQGRGAVQITLKALEESKGQHVKRNRKTGAWEWVDGVRGVKAPKAPKTAEATA